MSSLLGANGRVAWVPGRAFVCLLAVTSILHFIFNSPGPWTPTFNARNDPHPSAAVLAAFDLDLKHPLQALRPIHRSMPLGGSVYFVTTRAKNSRLKAWQGAAVAKDGGGGIPDD